MKNIYTQLAKVVIASAVTMLTGVAISAPLSLSDVPLFLKEEMPPNVILTLDNSGSMRRGWVFAEGIECLGNNSTVVDDKLADHPCFTSSDINKQYYNPEITYTPPLKADGTPFENANFNAAWIHGFKRDLVDSVTLTNTVDLGLPYTPTKVMYSLEGDTQWTPDTHERDAALSNNEGAYYSKLNTTISGCESITNFIPENTNCFDKVNVKDGTTDERQSFANWFSYYRTSMLSVQSAISTTFSDLDPDIRVAWQPINTFENGIASFSNIAFSTVENNYINAFSGDHKTNFYSWLYNIHAGDSTPLVPALIRVGEYMQSTSNINPFATNPGSSNHDSANDISCRSSFHTMFSDGAWNEGGGIDSSSQDQTQDADNESLVLPDGTLYAPKNPYMGTAKNYLADWAFLYWATDLRPDLPNNLKPYMPVTTGTDDQNYWNINNDPANWQHLVNYMVTLGVGGNLVNPDDLNDLISGAKTWGVDYGWDGPVKIDDNWHAAINSRGDYFAADKPSELTTAFSNILRRIGERAASASGVTTDSTQAADARYLYKAGFTSVAWTGTLQGFNLTIDPATQSLTMDNLAFDSACLLTGGYCTDMDATYPGVDYDDRKIISYNPDITTNDKEIAFRFGSLSASQQELLDNDATIAELKLNYLRGDRENEQDNGGDFRNRKSVMGDIIHSSPVLVKLPGRVFPDRGSWEDASNAAATIYENAVGAQSFSDFQQLTTYRHGMVYVGANNGMLHAFHAETGEEKFAYVPNAVFANLTNLTDPDYTHQYFVDGTPVSGEAFFDGDGNSVGEWHTMLLGQLRSGGQAVYGFDVTTEPEDTDTEADLANKLLWEFTHPDLGYGFGEPIIARLHNGRWAAIFGNGYNNTEADGNASTTGTASLFIVDIQTGELIRQIDTEDGTPATPNGISGVVAADLDGDFIDDFIYAGDLNGNLWKFDLTATTSDSWEVDYNDANGPIPLFSQNQPITGKPGITKHPVAGFLITFGTGKYLEASDNVNSTVVNSFYGVWDRNEYDLNTSITRDDLIPRELVDGFTDSGTEVRELTGAAMNYNDTATSDLGWYFDFSEGELQFTPPSQFDNDLTLFTTFRPLLDPCDPKGESWLYVIDTMEGNDPGVTTIDVDGNSIYDTDDNLASGGITSGIKLDNAGVIAPLKLMIGAETTGENEEIFDNATVITNDLDGTIGQINIRKRGQQLAGALEGRVKWRQIK